jgi:hypothetical protein
VDWGSHGNGFFLRLVSSTGIAESAHLVVLVGIPSRVAAATMGVGIVVTVVFVLGGKHGVIVLPEPIVSNGSIVLGFDPLSMSHAIAPFSGIASSAGPNTGSHTIVASIFPFTGVFATTTEDIGAVSFPKSIHKISFL